MSTACENLFWCNFEFGYKKQALGILSIRMPFLDPTTFPEPSGSCPGAPVKDYTARPVAEQHKSTAQRELNFRTNRHW